MKEKKIVTSEYVSYGHPDKVADQISDAILDEYLRVDSKTRAGIETMIKNNTIILGGEVKSNTHVNAGEIARRVLDWIKYPKSHHLSYEDIKVVNLIGEQSSEISKGVDKEDSESIGAGDQGFVAGMASNETDVYLPLGTYLSRQICQSVCNIVGFGPDAKTQVCVEYGDHIKPEVKSIVVSTMHDENLNINEVRKIIKSAITNNKYNGRKMIDDSIYELYIKGNKAIEYLINVNGSWTIGGPVADCGLTGRKIVVDQYGGYCNVGGGAFSGKDLSKVDRSGAYMCRYLAKNIVASGLADEAKVELSYVISKPEPCSLNVELKGADNTTKQAVERFIRERIDLTPNGLIKKFGNTTSFLVTAQEGHFGFTNDDYYFFRPWEETDFVGELVDYVNKIIE